MVKRFPKPTGNYKKKRQLTDFLLQHLLRLLTVVVCRPHRLATLCTSLPQSCGFHREFWTNAVWQPAAVQSVMEVSIRSYGSYGFHWSNLHNQWRRSSQRITHLKTQGTNLSRISLSSLRKSENIEWITQGSIKRELFLFWRREFWLYSFSLLWVCVCVCVCVCAVSTLPRKAYFSLLNVVLITQQSI